MPPLRLTLTATLLLLATGFSKDYLPPGGGWDYLFEGNAAASSATEALDGTWNHNNSSDQWGERLTLLSSQEDPIRDFSYDNSAPWPTAPDGDGYALMLINPHSNPNHSQCNNWQESVSVGGNPGFNDTISFSN